MVSGQNNILEGHASEWGSMIVCFSRSLRLASTRCLGLPELLLSAEAGGSWGGSHWWAAWAGVSLLWVPGQVLPILLPLPGPWDAGWVCDTAWLQHELLCRRTAVLWAGNRILLSWVSEGCAFGPVHASLGMHPACSRAGLVNVGSTAAKEKGERLLFGWVTFCDKQWMEDGTEGTLLCCLHVLLTCRKLCRGNAAAQKCSFLWELSAFFLKLLF